MCIRDRDNNNSLTEEARLSTRGDGVYVGTAFNLGDDAEISTNNDVYLVKGSSIPKEGRYINVISQYTGEMCIRDRCSDGSDWFKARSQWQERDYEPYAGDIIFFDWGGDGVPDHVGIVEKTEGGTVYTVEGNSGDACRENSYPVGDARRCV